MFAFSDSKTMAWILDEYSKFHGYSPAVVTGKPLVRFFHHHCTLFDTTSKVVLWFLCSWLFRNQTN
jgi:hypothetical protein